MTYGRRCDTCGLSICFGHPVRFKIQAGQAEPLNHAETKGCSDRSPRGGGPDPLWPSAKRKRSEHRAIKGGNQMALIGKYMRDISEAYNKRILRDMIQYLARPLAFPKKEGP